MFRLCASLCVAITISAYHLPQPSFIWTERLDSIYYNRNQCSLCYGPECLDSELSSCRYYAKTTEILMEPDDERSDDDPVTRRVFDVMLYNAFEIASDTYPDCIPLVSMYTDCTKDNICTGCKTCSCSVQGTWNCSSVSKCTPEEPLAYNHRTLVLVLNQLEEIPGKNKTRVNSINFKNGDSENINKLDLGVQRNRRDLNIVSGNVSVNVDDLQSLNAEPTKDINSKSDAELIKFDDMLSNVNNTIKHENDKILDLRQIPYGTESNQSDHDQFVHMLDALELDAPFGDINETVIDFLEVENMSTLLKFNNAVPNSIETPVDFNHFIGEEINSNSPNTSINLVKRDVSYLNNYVVNTHDNVVDIVPVNNQKLTNISISTTTLVPENLTNSFEDVKDNVLYPLVRIINDKQKELNKLESIKKHLMEFMKSYNNSDINFDLAQNDTDKNTYFSIYKLEVIPYLTDSIKNSNKTVLEKYVEKLKRDIREVIRDVVTVKKYSNVNVLPRDLENLVRALKSYVYYQKRALLTRRLDSSSDISSVNTNKETFINKITKIIKVLDKNLPKSDALKSLSPQAKKVLKRMLKLNYIYDSLINGVILYGSGYNLTAELINLGHNIEKISSDVCQNVTVNRLNILKTLYLKLSTNLKRLENAYTVVDFAHTRRLETISGDYPITIMQNIDTSLKIIITKVQNMSSLVKSYKLKTSNKKKRKTFLKQLQEMLRTSKNDILTLLGQRNDNSKLYKRVPKNYLKTALNTANEYENIMRKWQENLEVKPRRKRSLHRLGNRMNNILPKYLRGKLNPAITATMTRYNSHGRNKAHGKTNIEQLHIKKTTIKPKLKTPSVLIGSSIPPNAQGKRVAKTTGKQITTTPIVRVASSKSHTKPIKHAPPKQNQVPGHDKRIHNKVEKRNLNNSYKKSKAKIKG